MIGNDDFHITLTAARGGAEWAWCNLYQDLAPVVLRYLRARGAPEPEDLTGDVFVQVVRKLDQFSGSESDLRAWVITIAHHRLIDSARSRARRPVEPVADEVLATVSGSDDPGSEAFTDLRTGEIRKVIETLSPDQQEVIFLRFIAGLSINEVAATIRKNPGAVKALQARAVATMRRNLPQGVSL